MRDAAGIEGDELACSFTSDDGEIVVDEVEINLEDAAPKGGAAGWSVHVE